MNYLIIQKLNNKEESALKEIFDYMFPRLLYYSRKITVDHQISEDIVMTVMHKFWIRAKPYEDWNEALRVLFCYTRNASLNYKNRIQDKKISSFDFDENLNDEDCIDDSADELEIQIIKTELIARLHEAICSLPEKCKEIMLLYEQGHSGRKISKMLGISENTVYNQYMRAIAKIKTHLCIQRKA